MTQDTSPAPPLPAAPIVWATRNGKIARLPLAIREELNARLRNGDNGNKLIVWLNGLTEAQAVLASEFDGKPLCKQNLSRWRKGGFADWLRQQAPTTATML